MFHEKYLLIELSLTFSEDHFCSVKVFFKLGFQGALSPFFKLGFQGALSPFFKLGFQGALSPFLNYAFRVL